MWAWGREEGRYCKGSDAPSLPSHSFPHLFLRLISVFIGPPICLVFYLRPPSSGFRQNSQKLCWRTEESLHESNQRTEMKECLCVARLAFLHPPLLHSPSFSHLPSRLPSSLLLSLLSAVSPFLLPHLYSSLLLIHSLPSSPPLSFPLSPHFHSLISSPLHFSINSLSFPSPFFSPPLSSLGV